MPLTPAIRPVAHISSTADRPINAPPSSEAIGVKGVTFIDGSPDRACSQGEAAGQNSSSSNIACQRNSDIPEMMHDLRLVNGKHSRSVAQEHEKKREEVDG